MFNGQQNILYLVHRVPYPPNRGDRIRSYHLLRCLARHGNVHLAALADEPVPPRDLEELRALCVRMAVIPLGGMTRWLRAAVTLGTGRTATEGLFQAPQLKRTIRDWTTTTRFDAVVVFCSSLIQYCDCPELSDVPMVVDLVDVDSQKWFDYAARAPGVKGRLFHLEGRRLRTLEQSLSARTKAVTLVSEAEAELYRTICPDANVCGVPNGVDLDYFQPAVSAEDTGPLRCVFTGVLDYRANVEGLRWFCAEVWPEIRRRAADATFAIVGRRPTDAVRQLAKTSGVELIGEVPDVRPHIRRSTIAVVPLQTARGIQNKVLEAMAMGKPVVATPQALEGLGVEPDVHAVEAATPERWVEAILALHDSPHRREEIGRRARHFVETHHSWQECLEPFERLLDLAAPVTTS